MTGYSWLGVIISALGSSLALGGWAVMAVPYFDNAPYLTELRQHSRFSAMIGLLLFAIFFAIFYLGALYLDQDTSGPLLAFAAFILLLPGSMLLGTETWERYNPKGINKVPGFKAVAVATSIGLAEISGVTAIVMILIRIS
jgi:hypothetical protein